MFAPVINTCPLDSVKLGWFFDLFSTRENNKLLRENDAAMTFSKFWTGCSCLLNMILDIHFPSGRLAMAVSSWWDLDKPPEMTGRSGEPGVRMFYFFHLFRFEF